MGQFINFYLPFNGVSNEDQALSIIKEAQKLIAAGSPGVAITYSANYGQTVTINKTYDSGGWDTGTNGSNQAAVMHDMETLMGKKYTALQHKLEIAPITTMTYTDYGKYTHKQVIESDLEHIKALLKKGWDVLGWINQDSKPNYAVGGGVAGALPKEINDLIQTTLADYAKDSKQ